MTTRVLLTSFGPFPGVPRNSSMVYVDRLARMARRHFPAAKIATARLETSWATAHVEAEKAVERHAPDILVHVGVAGAQVGLRLETFGRNEAITRPDVRGCLPPAAHLAERGPPTIPATWPVGAIADRLASLAIPYELSPCAGGYLCNSVLYHSLCRACVARTPSMVGFLHILDWMPGLDPSLKSERVPSPAEGVIELAEALSGGIEILRVCLATMSSKRPAGPVPGLV